jgi:hypothetical protein
MIVFLRHTFFTTVFLSLALSWFSGVAQHPAINEFMASNSMTIADEDGDFEDWIEFYNAGEHSLDLEGFGLSDDFEDPFKWVFPNLTILPGQFLLVWASGKNRTNPLAPLHTNFSIRAEGEELLLTNPSGTLIDEVQPLALPTDISYGRIPDGAAQWYYFDEPTPGESNTTQGFSEILEPPVFSHPGGFYADELELELSHPDPEVTIYYTLDGSIPDPDNLEGTVYQYKNQYPENPGDPFGDTLTASFGTHLYNPALMLLISDRSTKPDKLTQISSTFHFFPYYFPQVPVYKGTSIRSVAVKPSAISSKTATQSYFITDDGENPYNLPVISLNVQENHFFDYFDGIYVAGVDFDNWRLANPNESACGNSDANFFRTGEEWEFPINFEYFDAVNAKTSLLNQMAGVRIHGNWTRTIQNKSLRLYARNRYHDDFLQFPFFSYEDFDKFSRLILRNSGDDWSWTYFRDAATQAIVSSMNFDTQAYQPAVLFLNGEYWGITNIRERYDKYYLARVYDIDPDNIDLLENEYSVIEGDATHYTDMLNYLSDNDMAQSEHYEYIKTQMDVDNYIDYFIAGIFIRNDDWPHHNIYYWRTKTDEFLPDAPVGHDGRWRWMLYDTDAGFGLSKICGNKFSFDMIGHVTNPLGNCRWEYGPWINLIMVNLMDNDDFRTSFITRFADMLNTVFLPERATDIIINKKQKLLNEMPTHISRWQEPQNINFWHESVDTMLHFADVRPGFQRQHIIEHFDLPGTFGLSLDVSNHWHGHIRVNTIEITEETPGIDHDTYPWSGIYFESVPVELEAKPAHGYAFCHWDGDITGNEAIVTIQPENDFFAIAHFVRDNSPKLIHYWLFDVALPNDTPLDSLDAIYAFDENGLLAFYSALAGYPFDPDHPDWRKASMERRNAPTPLNYRPEGNNNISYDDSEMRGIQIRQPFTGDGGENTLVFNIPTIDFQNIIFRFAAMDEGAADQLLIDYSIVEQDPVWISNGLENPSPELSENYQLYEVDFSDIDLVNNNPHFKIRIRFDGEDMSVDNGSRVTFNNFSLDGVVISGLNLPPEIAEPIILQNAIEQSDAIEIDLHNVFMDPDNDPLTFAAMSNRPEMAAVNVNGSLLTIIPEKRGDTWITISADDNINDPVSFSFRVMTYPKAFVLDNNAYHFNFWSADEPEYSYPENVIFLQSNVSDPGIYEPLAFPYFIPHDDYHEDDQLTIGFPYNNSRRSRINGLGEDGISFINTGRNRDPGGLLLALDTREVTGATLTWLAETILQSQRTYAIGLFYRTDINAPFGKLMINDQHMKYISGATGDILLHEEILLPGYLLDQDYVQLLWKYYHKAGDSGPRDEIRLDEIEIKDVTFIPEIPEDEIKIHAAGGELFFQLPDIMEGTISIFDVSGRLVKNTPIKKSTRFNISLYPHKGVFLVRLISSEQIITKKIVLY